ncbi:thioredoxin-disulfide reductase [Candidatus Sumerlaeota bacterium]|nr:thioredoxin-disulfide reductase [Candidatus Sumerlaeota bacterium]
MHDVVIAGSGPAGLTAAIYAGRANLKPVVIEGDDLETRQEPGGQLMITTDVENYPGFPKGIMGPALVNEFRQQAARFDTQFIASHIASADLSKRPFTATLTGGKKLQSRTLIISTGASARLLGLPAEKEFMSKIGGVSACATCDGPLFKNREVVVVGGGDTAMEEANYLARLCSKVTVVHRRDTLRASKIMQDRAFKNPKIQFIWNSAVEDILDLSQKKVTAVRLKNLKDGTVSDYKCDGVFIAIGHDPNTKFLNGQLKTDAHGFIVVEEPSTRTSVAGVFACGDVMDPNYKQAVTAAGTGCRAAIDAERFLEAERAAG